MINQALLSKCVIDGLSGPATPRLIFFRRQIINALQYDAKFSFRMTGRRLHAEDVVLPLTSIAFTRHFRVSSFLKIGRQHDAKRLSFTKERVLRSRLSDSA